MGEQRAGCIGEGDFLGGSFNSKCVSATAGLFFALFFLLPRTRHEVVLDTDHGSYKRSGQRSPLSGYMVGRSSSQRWAVMAKKKGNSRVEMMPMKLKHQIVYVAGSSCAL